MRLPRKSLTPEQAKQLKSTILQMIWTIDEDTMFWRSKIGCKLSPLEEFIIFSDKTVSSPQDIVDRNEKQVIGLRYRLDNYVAKYL